ncbi:MAG: hypothetical protein ACSHYF_07360 [Verrucomicrobiaceae bacterium]
MKNILYIIAVVAIAAAGVFGWQVKSKTEEKIEARNALKAQNTQLTKTINTETDNKKAAEEATAAAQSGKDEAVASVDNAKAKEGDLKRTLDQEESRLASEKARVAKVDKFVAEIKKQLDGDVELDEIPGIVDALREEKNVKTKKVEELDLIREKLERNVTESQAEIVRVSNKIQESKARVSGNTFQASVASVNNEWGFLVINAGEKSGLSGDSKLILTRDGRSLGKVLISSLEANQAIAEVVPESIAPGVRPQPGDSVILANTAAN